MKHESGGEAGRHDVSFRTALGWSYVMQGGQYAISTIVTFVLAAIVGPQVFGLVAMAMVYLTFIQLLVRQGMIPALVQRRTLEDEHINGAFWLVVASGIVLTAASVLLSGWWASLNRTPELESVINALSIVIILQSLIVVQEALLSRRMDFRSLAIRTNSSALVGGAVGLVLALSGFGVWALVVQNIVKALVDVVVLWGLSEWRPRFDFSWPAARELLGFSTGTTLVSFGSFVNGRADALLVGLFFGPTAVGLYRLGTRLVEVVVEVTVRSFQSVSLPELSRLQHDPQRFAHRITNMIGSTALIAFPALGLLAGSSHLVMAALGPEWADAATPLSVLCIAGAATALSTFAGSVSLSVGRPHLLAIVTWISATLSATSFVVAGLLLMEATVGEQVLGIAVTRVALFAIATLALAGWVILRLSETSLSSLVRAAIPATMIAGLAFVLTRLFASLTLPGGGVMQLVLVLVPMAILTATGLASVDSRVRGVLISAARRLHILGEAVGKSS